MFKDDDPIYIVEKQEMHNQLDRLIRSHNLACAICDIFENNKIAKQYFDYGKDEVLDSGNQSLSSMYVTAIFRMCDFIEEHSDEDSTDIEELQIRIYNLENENRRLKSKLQQIKELSI